MGLTNEKQTIIIKVVVDSNGDMKSLIDDMLDAGVLQDVIEEWAGDREYSTVIESVTTEEA